MTCKACRSPAKFQCGETDKCTTLYCSQACGDHALSTHICSQFIGTSWDEIPGGVIMQVMSLMPLDQLWRLCATEKRVSGMCKDVGFRRTYLQYRGRDEVERIIMRELLRKFPNEPNESVLEEWVPDALATNTFRTSIRAYLPFVLSAKHGFTNLTRVFLDTARNDFVIEVVMEDALNQAAAWGRTEVVDLLLKDRHMLLYPDSKALIEAAFGGHTQIVWLLLQDGRIDPAAYESRALRTSAEYGHAGVVCLLLKDGRADPTMHQSFVLRTAAKVGHVGVVRLLLEDGRADPSIRLSEALRYAAQWGHLEIVRMLLEDGRADPTAEGYYARKAAKYEGHTDIVNLLDSYKK